jgi:glucose uptake protein GlcU
MEFDNENHSQQQNILNGMSFARGSFGMIVATRRDRAYAIAFVH